MKPSNESTHNDEVGCHQEKPRRPKSAPSESSEQKRSSNAGKGEPRNQNRRAQKKDQEVAEDCRLPRGGGGLDQGDCVGDSTVDSGGCMRRPLHSEVGFEGFSRVLDWDWGFGGENWEGGMVWF